MIEDGAYFSSLIRSLPQAVRLTLVADRLSVMQTPSWCVYMEHKEVRFS